MKFLSKEETDNYIPLRGGRTTAVAAALARLQVGESIIIEKGKDWITKSSPWGVVNGFAKRHNRKFDKGRANDGTGWWVKRVA